MNARKKQADLPNCPRMELRYKDVPYENSDGEPLGRCMRCEGSGETCTATKTTFDRTGGTSTETLAEFPGSHRAGYHRRGWKVEGTSCAACRGAGLVRRTEEVA